MPASLRVTSSAALIVLLSAVTLNPVAADANQAMTVEDVIAKNLAARGGAEKLKSLTSVKITGVVSAQGMELPMTSWAMRPNRMRRDTKFQDQTIVIAFDGTTVLEMTGPTAKPNSGPAQIGGKAGVELLQSCQVNNCGVTKPTVSQNLAHDDLLIQLD